MTHYMPLHYYQDYENKQQQQQGLMSISQPETPRPGSTTPPMKDNKTARPYPTPTMRRRKTESFFSFEMGPQFTDTKQFYELCSMDQSNNYQVNLYAKMDRGFFRADQDWTCYRRNYFQISSVFQIQSMNYELRGPEVPCLLRKPQELLQVDYFSIGISARVTNNDKKIDLVQHTPKRDKGPQMVPEPRPVRAGGNLHLASVGSNHNIATFERLQFKTATANNGKRRAAQQYYEIVVDLIAHMAHHPPLCVASCVSEPLVVRGRSPGHYSDSHTRFKHMEPTLEAMSSPSQKYTNSLPSSPMSDLGPYSPYHGYPYPSLSTGYSMMNPPMPQYPNNPNQEASYFQQTPQPMYTFDNKIKLEETKSDYYDSRQYHSMYNTPYQGRPHHEENSHFSAGLDAGRS